MKVIQVVDGAENCTYPVYEVTDADFQLMFPAPGQDIEFAQEIAVRLGGDAPAGALISRSTARKIDKRRLAGIHGTLFIDLPGRRKFFPNRREDDVYVP